MKKQICQYKRVSPNDGFQYFFGYYDKCPWNRTQQMILAHRSNFIDHFPKIDDSAEVGYINLQNGEFTSVGQTTAWNWQQGAMLQWLYRDGKEEIIFNHRDSQLCPKGTILNPPNGEMQELPLPVYALSPNQREYLSLNFYRLYYLRKDYGLTPPPTIGQDLGVDGIFRCELDTLQVKCILSCRDLRDRLAPDVSESLKFEINHMMYNPSGSRFCFLFRYNDTSNLPHCFLVTAAADGSDVRVVYRGAISHYGWFDDEHILAWGGKRKLLGEATQKGGIKQILKRSLKPIYYALGKPRILMSRIIGDSYWNVRDSAVEDANAFAKGELYCDGHCTVSPDKKWMVTDGYTDSLNRLPLFLWNLEQQYGIEIGRFFLPKELDKEIRVDLHPRWSRDGKQICIDSAMDGQRGIYVVDVSEITEK